MKIICTLETKISKLFESNKQFSALPTTESDVQIKYHAVPFIQYEQIRLNTLYKQYLQTNLLSKSVFRTGLQKLLLKKSYELASSSHFYRKCFDDANKQYDWLDTSLVFHKNDQNTTIFENCKTEFKSTFLRKAKVENITNTYSVANVPEFDLNDKGQKHQIYKHL